MVWNKLSICLTLLSLIPGVLCEYDYNIGGLVAAAVVSFFMLLLIIMMIIVIVMWRDWFEKKQMIRGIPKRPRRYWGFFPARNKSPSILLSTPRSDRKHLYVGKPHVLHHGSRSTTLTRADEWLTKLPPPPQEVIAPQYRYEEKVQTMNFEPEEDNVIIADLLPENDTRHTQKTTTVDYDNAPRKLEFESKAEVRQEGVNEYYVSYGGTKSDYRTRQQLRHTVASTPYHVKMTHLQDEPNVPSNDLFIAPNSPVTSHSEPRVTIADPVNVQPIVIPAEEPSSVQPIVIPVEQPVVIQDETPGPSGIGRDSPQLDTDKVAVMTFADSDEEAGMIPNVQPKAENDVLF